MFCLVVHLLCKTSVAWTLNVRCKILFHLDIKMLSKEAVSAACLMACSIMPVFLLAFCCVIIPYFVLSSKAKLCGFASTHIQLYFWHDLGNSNLTTWTKWKNTLLVTLLVVAQGLKIYNHSFSSDLIRILSTRIQNPALEDCEECYFIGGSWYQICFRENNRLPAFLLTVMVEYYYEPEWSKGKSALAEIQYFSNLTTQVNTCRQRSVDSTTKMAPTSLVVSVVAV